MEHNFETSSPRATIAHLRVNKYSHWNLAQIRTHPRCYGQGLVTSKNEEGPIKIEGARVATLQNIDFSNTKGQLTPQSKVGSGRNTSEIL